MIAKQVIHQLISIHTSAKEATLSTAGIKVAYAIISIHASAREATATRNRLILNIIFQSTPPRGRQRKRKHL